MALNKRSVEVWLATAPQEDEMLDLGNCLREKAQKLLLVANRTSDPNAAVQLRKMSGEILSLAARVDAKEFGAAVLDID